MFSIRDMQTGVISEAMAVVFDCFEHCSDPCPQCGAFRMDAGYYYFMGCCNVCADAEAKAYDEWENR